MFLIPGNTYADFAAVMQLAGVEGLARFQTEVVPTQDLTRFLQGRRVKHTLYNFATVPAADEETTLQWADASDWDNIIVNGVALNTATADNDGDLPQDTDDRIIVHASLQVSGTIADYTTAQANREAIFGPLMIIATWQAVVTGHQPVPPTGPWLLPQVLQPNEVEMHIRAEVSGNAANMQFMIQMVSAPSGVLSPYPGV